VKVYDEAVLPVTKDEMVSIGQEMMAMVKDYNSDIIVSAGAGKGVNRGEFANSSGVTYTTEDTNFGVHIGGQWTRGTDILWAGEGFGWKKRDIDHSEIARKAIQWFKMAENIAPIKSGDMPVIFDPQGMIVLLLALGMGFDGKNVFLGASPLAGRLGEEIADERLSITDNPLMDYASSSGKYDDEGVPRQITPLIENGVVRNFLYDLDTAGRAGTKSTGHGTDRHDLDKTPVGCMPTNVVIEEGDVSYEEMVKNTKEGLLVRDVMGLGQGNPISGEFSLNVQLGYKIENGEIVGRVKDVMLAGNTYDAIKNIAAIGDKAEWASGSVWALGSIESILTPPAQISELSVVAK
jgi:PmbA protein